MSVALRLAVLLTSIVFCRVSTADSYGDSFASWLNERGQEYWGELPQECDDFTFIRRVYLDTLGRVPSVSEIRDFQEIESSRREKLIDQLVYVSGDRKLEYERLNKSRLAKAWSKVLLPPGIGNDDSVASLEVWLKEKFSSQASFREIVRELSLANEGSSNYFQLVGSLPENYASNLSRAFLGVRIECAQCHDHPFASWKQRDFWGLAAFYGDLASGGATKSSSISHEGVLYDAKVLWSESSSSIVTRRQFAEWLTSDSNPNFAATIVNRTWQQLVGSGLYPDIENLDAASPEERRFLDEVALKFVESNFDLNGLTNAIMKSRWYQASASGTSSAPGQFARGLKVISPDQVFDSLEQSLLLSRTRIDSESPRWSGERIQFVRRLNETATTDPQEYQSGIPQSLMLMNGDLTGRAVDVEDGRLLRAVVDAPFLDSDARIETLFLAVLSRPPSAEEVGKVSEYLAGKESQDLRQAYSDVLWALINSPEFVLCR